MKVDLDINIDVKQHNAYKVFSTEQQAYQELYQYIQNQGLAGEYYQGGFNKFLFKTTNVIWGVVENQGLWSVFELPIVSK